MKKFSMGTALVAACCLSAALGAGFAIYLRPATASRNSSGTYSLFTPGNPVVSGTVGSSTWANNTLNDISTEITSSLDRSGRGGMLAALRGIDGTLAAPALSFTSETGSGLWRNGAGDVRMSILGTAKGFWSATGFGVGVAPLAPLHVLKTATSGVTPDARSSAIVEGSTGHFLALNAPNAQFEGILFGDVSNANRGYIQYNNSTSGSADQMQFATNALVRTTISNSGLTIGASGTAISGSFRGTASRTPAAINTQTCSTLGGSITVTGAVSGSECTPILPSSSDALSAYCNAGTNACTIIMCNPTAGSVTPTSGTYGCRVFNP